MKKYYKFIYYPRLYLYIIHLIILFLMLSKIIKVNVIGIIYIVTEIILIINTLLELLSKKERYKRDLAYNIMNYGYLTYFYLFIFRVYKYSLNYITSFKYMMVNLIVLTSLIIILIIFSRIILKDYKK